jgi:putative membrane protein
MAEHAALVGPALLAVALGYAAAWVASRHRGRWPVHRGVLWFGGLGSVAAGLLGPPAVAADHDFTAHAAVHLLLGMLAPLALVLAAPVTLLLRALPVAAARRVSRLAASRPVRFLTHPVPAAVLNAGGLWLLYPTALYPATHHQPALHLAVHAHLLLAGYLWTNAIVGVDPAPHRPGHLTRAVVLVLFLAAHAILAKYLYAHPPAGVPIDQGRRGAVLMYYGGDAVDLGLIVVFCRQWFQEQWFQGQRFQGQRFAPAHDRGAPREEVPHGAPRSGRVTGGLSGLLGGGPR